MAAEFPKEDPGKGITVIASSDVRVHPELDVVLVALAGILLSVVGLVLAIACSNLATLLLVRGTARAKEVSIRLAVGAARGGLVRHLLIESLLLALLGGAAGCLIAWWAIQSLDAVNLPIGIDIDARRARAGLCARRVARHGPVVRTCAGAQGHQGRFAVVAARRR